MEKYLDPTTKKVMEMANNLANWFLNYPNEWKPEIDEYIEKLSNGKLRVFQTFFHSPSECLSGSFQPQVLEEKDIKAMYPKFETSVKNLPKNTYCYIFSCNGAANNGRDAVIMQTFIKFP